MILNTKGHLHGKWIIAPLISPSGNLDSLTTTGKFSTVLVWGLKRSLVCGMTTTVAPVIFTSARNQPMVCVRATSRITPFFYSGQKKGIVKKVKI